MRCNGIAFQWDIWSMIKSHESWIMELIRLQSWLSIGVFVFLCFCVFLSQKSVLDRHHLQTNRVPGTLLCLQFFILMHIVCVRFVCKKACSARYHHSFFFFFFFSAEKCMKWVLKYIFRSKNFFVNIIIFRCAIFFFFFFCPLHYLSWLWICLFIICCIEIYSVFLQLRLTVFHHHQHILSRTSIVIVKAKNHENCTFFRQHKNCTFNRESMA